MGNPGIVIFFLTIIGIAYVILLLYSYKPKRRNCDFCKDDDIIVVYREMRDRERGVAKFCPYCGRKL